MNYKHICWLMLALLSALLFACGEGAPENELIEQLISDVFDPQPGEKILVMTDIPHDNLADYSLWSDRRLMAEEWRQAFANLEDELEISVHPLLSYPATGAHNGPLPTTGLVNGDDIPIEQLISDSNIIVALTEYSATAPLFEFTEKYPKLRAASMPTVSRSMEQTALAADYAVMAPKCNILAEALDKANSAHLVFSNGDELFVDLRYRDAHLDDGQLHTNKSGERVINLPSGEAYIAPYEGENVAEPSKTTGIIPIPAENGTFERIRVEENRVVESLSTGQAAETVWAGFKVDDGRRNLAELGLGCNDMAVVTGNVLEDEKVFGVHLATGLSEHIGGTVGISEFVKEGDARHLDIVFPFGGSIEVSELTLEFEHGTVEQIIADGRYLIFDEPSN